MKRYIPTRREGWTDIGPEGWGGDMGRGIKDKTECGDGGSNGVRAEGIGG